jgi:hypothetical protein
MRVKYTTGVYELGTNILQLHYPSRVDLADERTIVAFFDEVEHDWIRPCIKKPYLLVDYRNVHLAPKMTDVYAHAIERFKALVLGTFRYGIAPDLTGVAVSMGNMKLASQANIFPDEAAARAAIEKHRAAAR